MNNDKYRLQKVFDYLANEWDLFNLPWDHSLLAHIKTICKRTGLTPEETTTVRDALIGRILDLEEMNATQLLNLYEKWSSRQCKPDEENEFRLAILNAIRGEFAAFRRA